MCAWARTVPQCLVRPRQYAWMAMALANKNWRSHSHSLMNGGNNRICQARKRNPNPNFSVRISSGGVGVFHVKGWGPKASVCPSKPRETSCPDIPRHLPGCPGGVRKVREKESLCSILVPIIWPIDFLWVKASQTGVKSEEQLCSETDVMKTHNTHQCLLLS